jgi:two-component system cell cycle response regulator DivK
MKTVLVVEDNEVNMKLVRFVLSEAGYSVLEAGTAEDGLRLAREHRPSLVLLDIHLPGMDGLTAARQLRADPVTHGIKLLALTASAMKGDRERILASGFDGYLGKPLPRQELLDAVSAALAG